MTTTIESLGTIILDTNKWVAIFDGELQHSPQTVNRLFGVVSFPVTEMHLLRATNVRAQALATKSNTVSYNVYSMGRTLIGLWCPGATQPATFGSNVTSASCQGSYSCPPVVYPLRKFCRKLCNHLRNNTQKHSHRYAVNTD